MPWRNILTEAHLASPESSGTCVVRGRRLIGSWWEKGQVSPGSRSGLEGITGSKMRRACPSPALLGPGL